MKGVRCSWVDMQKIREALASGERGDQARLERMRCVDHSTVSTWKAACEVLDALDGKCELANVSTFQPTHAVEIARAFRQSAGPSAKWTDDTKQAITEWVDRCEAEQLTVQQLRTRLAEVRPAANGHAANGCTVDDLHKLLDAGRKFGTVYADPPWAYGNQATRAATDNHYRTMTPEEVAALPVRDLAADAAHLHLWTTNAFLRESFAVLEAWGFAYKSLLVWDKEIMGLGNYWRVQTEYLLLGVRGDLVFRDHGIPNVLRARRGEHSSKPDQVRGLIERASPGPYLELFGRRAAKGWTVWGNEIESDLFTRHLEAL